MDVIILIFESYLIPFVYAIGVIYFIYGFIEYHIIGKEGDEERMQHGRELLFKAVVWFVIGLILFGFLTVFNWLSDSWESSFGQDNDINLIPIEHEREDSYLPVPNVPTRGE